jgi:hypothetical protein
MTDEPKQDQHPSTTDEAFEEALDAARVFSDLAGDEAGAVGEGLDDDVVDDEAGRAQEAEAFADEFELPAPQPAAVAVETEPASAEPEAEETDDAAAVEPMAAQVQPGGASIGELFRPVVKHSPPSKIRIEADSIGALFHRFIEQR